MDVRIDCVFYDGLVPRSESDEYVQVTNYGDGVNLAGWVLLDGDEGSPRLVFPDLTLQSGQSIRIYTNEVHPEWGGFSFGSGRAVWNNSDPDVAVLLDADGSVMSSRTYPPGC